MQRVPLVALLAFVAVATARGAPTDVAAARRDRVVDALRDSWSTYKRHAWGTDEVRPQQQRGHNWHNAAHGIGATIIDALDTLLLVGMTEEAAEAVEWIDTQLDFDAHDGYANVFETNIRVLGGLLGAYERCNDTRLLRKAEDIGGRLSHAFHTTPSGLPKNNLHLRTLKPKHDVLPYVLRLAEVGTLQMEFFALAVHTGKAEYWEQARHVVEVIEPSCVSGFCPLQYLREDARPYAATTGGLGSYGDSFYEYLLKVWILGGKKDQLFGEMWRRAADYAIASSTRVGGLLIPNGADTDNKLEHLACFSGGLFALSYMHTGNATHLDFAKEVAATCRALHSVVPGGVPPEMVRVVLDEDTGALKLRIIDAKSVLRPETVETYFYLWRATHDPKYRDWAWEVFEAIDKHLRVSTGGYAGTKDITWMVPQNANDNMETFWFAETLKYLYLLFSEDELIDLNEWVFNTEAHAVRVKHASGLKGTRRGDTTHRRTRVPVPRQAPVEEVPVHAVSPRFAPFTAVDACALGTVAALLAYHLKSVVGRG